MTERTGMSLPTRLSDWLTGPDTALETQEAIRRSQRLTFKAVVGLGLVAAVALVFSVGWKCGGALFAASTAASVGGFAGFLFGIPRTSPEDDEGRRSPKQEQTLALRPNTNLERISDWLTKMLVGVGLTQAQQIAPTIRHLADLVKPSFNGNMDLAAYCIVTFTIWGFFGSYLAFRMFFTMAFSVVDNAATITQKAERLERSDNNAQAALAFQDALSQLPADASPAKRRQVAEGVVMNALYRDPPDGFRQAIAAGKDYFRRSDSQPAPYIHAYLSAAYGQQYSYEKQQGAPPERLAEVEALAFHAAQESTRLDPSTKSLLHSLWDPADQVADEDDLQVFHPSQGKPTKDWVGLLN